MFSSSRFIALASPGRSLIGASRKSVVAKKTISTSRSLAVGPRAFQHASRMAIQTNYCRPFSSSAIKIDAEKQLEAQNMGGATMPIIDGVKIPFYKFVKQYPSLLTPRPQELSFNEIFDEAISQGNYILRLLTLPATGKELEGAAEMLKEQFNASLDVSNGEFESVITLKCQFNHLNECLKEICNNIQEMRDENLTELRLLMHASQANQIIRGFTNKQRKECLQRFDLKRDQLRRYNQYCPISSEEALLLTLPKNELPEAVCKITKVLQEHQVKNLWLPYDPKNANPYLAKDYAGFSFKNREIHESDEGKFLLKVTLPKNLTDVLDEQYLGLRSIRNEATGILLGSKTSKSGIITLKFEGYPVFINYALWLLAENIKKIDGGAEYLEKGVFDGVGYH